MKARSKRALYISDSFMFLKINNNPPRSSGLCNCAGEHSSESGRREGVVAGGTLRSSVIVGQSVAIPQMSAERPKHTPLFGDFLWSLLMNLFVKPFGLIYHLKREMLAEIQVCCRVYNVSLNEPR